MRRPDITRKKESIEKEVERWAEAVVRPYLIHLLDKAQARLRHPLKLSQGNGDTTLDRDEPFHEWYNSVFYRAFNEGYCLSKGHEKLRERFPEIIEVLEVAECVEDELEYTFVLVIPSIPPKTSPDRSKP